jgi:fibronectin-binding autotransporter adhesin
MFRKSIERNFAPRQARRYRQEPSRRRTAAAPLFEALEDRALLSINGTSLLSAELIKGATFNYTDFSSASSTTESFDDTTIGPATAPTGQNSIEFDSQITEAGFTNSFLDQTYLASTSAGIVLYAGVTSAITDDGSVSTTDSSSFSPPQISMPATLTAGQTVDSSSTVTYQSEDAQGQTSDSTSTQSEAFTLVSETPQSISVPAGTFNAYEVDSTTTDQDTSTGDTKTTTDQGWYVPNVGCVKAVGTSSDSTATTTFVLESYSIPSDTLQFGAQPAKTPSGQSMAPVSVQLLDTNGNLDTSSSAAVTLTLVGGTATLGGTTTVNAVNGVATFKDLSVDVPGNYTLQASSTASASNISSDSFQITGDHLVFTTEPADSAPNAPIDLVVAAEDLDNNIDTSATGTIDLSLNVVEGDGATLDGTTELALTDGVATFTTTDAPTVSANGAYTLTATHTNTAAQATAATSAQFTVSKTLTWNGLGNGTSWSDAKNWVQDEAPVGGDSLLFPTGAPLSTNNDISGLSIATIDIAGGGYTVTGDAISLAGGLTSEAGNNTFDIATALVGSPTLVDQTGDLTVQSIISGGGLTFGGNGIFTLDQSDSYTGTTILSSGVTIDDEAGSGAFGSGSITLGAGTVTIDAGTNPATINNPIQFQDDPTLRTGPTVILGGPLTLNGPSTLASTNPTDELDLLSSTIQGTGTLSLQGQGLVVLKDNVAATVQVQVLSGSLNLAANLQATGATPQLVVNGGTVAIYAGTSGGGGIDVASGSLFSGISAATGYNGTVTLESKGSIDWVDGADGDGVGTGTLDLKGGTLINALPAATPTAKVGNPITLEGDVQIDDPDGGGTGANVIIAGTTTVAAPSNLNVTSAASLEFAATSELQSPNPAANLLTVTGSVVQFMGTLSTAVDLETDNNAVKDSDLLAGTLNALGSVTLNLPQTSAVLRPQLSGSGTITVKQGTLLTSASGATGYSGTVTLQSGGTIDWFDAADAQGVGTGTLDLLGGTLSNLLDSDSTVAATLNNPITLEGDVQIETDPSGVSFGGATTVAAPSTLNVSGSDPLFYAATSELQSPNSASAGDGLTLTGAMDVQFSGTISTLVELETDNVAANAYDMLSGTLTGAGRVTINLPRTTAALTPDLAGGGDIVVQQGTLLSSGRSAAAPGAAGFHGDILVQAAGTVDDYDSVDASGLGTGPIFLNGGLLQNSAGATAVVGNAVTVGVSSTISSMGERFKLAGGLKIEGGTSLTVYGSLVLTGSLSGSGTLHLETDFFAVAGSNPGFSGSVGVTSGVVDLDKDDALGTAGFSSSSAVVLQSMAIGDPVINNPVTVQGGTLTVDGQFTFPSGVTIASGASLQVVGAGSQVVVSGPLAGAGTLLLSAGTFTPTGPTTSFTGAVQLQNGLITLTPAVDAGRSAFVITLYEDLLAQLPSPAELVAAAGKLKSKASYANFAHGLTRTKAYKNLQRHHKGTGISFNTAFAASLRAASRAGLTIPVKR